MEREKEPEREKERGNTGCYIKRRERRGKVSERTVVAVPNLEFWSHIAAP
jgi:hypothetical protein